MEKRLGYVQDVCVDFGDRGYNVYNCAGSNKFSGIYSLLNDIVIP